MGLYRGLYSGWRREGAVPQFSLASLDTRMHEDYAFVCVCLISLSVYQFVCPSKSLYIPLSLPLSLSLSLSICGVDLADQGSRARYRAIQVFSWDSNQSRSRLTLAGRSPVS